MREQLKIESYQQQLTTRDEMIAEMENSIHFLQIKIEQLIVEVNSLENKLNQQAQYLLQSNEDHRNQISKLDLKLMMQLNQIEDLQHKNRVLCDELN